MTTTLPDRVPRVLHLYDAGPHEWNYRGNALYHNRSRTQFQHIPSLDKLSTHQTVGLLICTNGQLHMYIDGHHSECIANGLPVHKPLFGAVHVCENCTMIKSEFLSGELVFMLLYMCLAVFFVIHNILKLWQANEFQNYLFPL